MHFARLSKTVLPFMVLIMIIGCKSKQDKPGASAPAPQEKAGAPAVTPQDKTGAPVVTPQDKSDARAAAARVLSQFEAGEFSQIYKDASPGFKQIGSESQFVAKFQQTRQKTGVLKNPREVSFDTRPDKNHVIIYRLEGERFKTDIRLTFARSRNGVMELAGLNQHDEPKK